MRSPRHYQLTAALVASHGGGPVVYLDASAIGRSYRLHTARPGPELNVPIGPRADVIGAGGIFAPEVTVEESVGPAVTRVEIMGPIEQRAGYHGDCGGWSDGHDAIAERLCDALEHGDVLLVIDSPGGAAAGIDQAVQRVLAAKAEHGRRITGYADEQIGSAAYYWAACVCDEIYLPPSGIVGSIGARASHWSEAGALAIDGIAVTHFAWPGAGKVALAPELPLSELGKERGERDVTISGEAFCAAVCAARPQLTRDAIVALDADCLTGMAAVDAGLADGVASLVEVEEYALTLAGAAAEGAEGAEERTMSLKSKAGAIRSEEPGKDEPKPDAPADKVSSECGSCGLNNETDAKFCKGCGASMATRAEDEPEEEPKPEERAAPPAPAKPGAQARSYASIAQAAGLREGASTLAIKTSVVRMRQSLDRYMTATGARTMDELDGAIAAIAEDAKRLAKVEQDMAALKARADEKERMDLLLKLAAADLGGDNARGQLIVDQVDDVTGARTMIPNPKSLIASAPLGKLRGYVTAKIDNTAPTAAAAPKRSPFEPDADAVQAAASGAAVTQRDREIAAKHGYDPAKVAAARTALFSNNGASRGA